MAQSPTGFTYVQTGDKVVITHHGRRATTLRGNVAARFLTEVENVDPHQLMARLTGNYKHGNERTARYHPRNQTR
ncbi:MAG: hypothetical protein ABIZ07_09255 [Dermatophilaceae bacterium]